MTNDTNCVDCGKPRATPLFNLDDDRGRCPDCHARASHARVEWETESALDALRLLSNLKIKLVDLALIEARKGPGVTSIEGFFDSMDGYAACSGAYNHLLRRL
jgi:hypothetical protein